VASENTYLRSPSAKSEEENLFTKHHKVKESLVAVLAEHREAVPGPTR